MNIEIIENIMNCSFLSYHLFMNFSPMLSFAMGKFGRPELGVECDGLRYKMAGSDGMSIIIIQLVGCDVIG